VTESDDLRTFIRELLLRSDRRMEVVLARLDRQAAEASEERRRYFEKINAHQNEDREKLDEILAEGRAGREALFRMLDRLDNGGTAPAA
jgi:hypothetical protein